MDTIGLMREVIAEADKVVQGVRSDQLSAQSPCTEWTVRDVINHITGGSTMFAICVEDGAIADEQLGALMAGDNLGDDFVGAWSAAAARAIHAFESPGALDKIVTLPFGTMPASIALNIAVFDVLTHAADIATATGQTLQNADLIETALGVGHEMITPELRMPGLFDVEQPAPPAATPAQRLLAFAGRKVG
jgi:uncharacterized protein (TIGR03086 family)